LIVWSANQEGKTNLDLLEQETASGEWQWHQLGQMQICTLTQTHNHVNIPPLSFLQAGCPSCRPTNSGVYSGPKLWSPGPRRRGDIFLGGGIKFSYLLLYI